MRIGPLGILLAPGWGTCGRCHTPWKFVDQHTVWPKLSHGYFVLCEKCWDACTPEQRVAYYEHKRQQVWTFDIGPRELREAVLKG